MLIVVVISVETLPDEGKKGRERNQPPHAPSERARALRPEPAKHGRYQRRQRVNPIAPKGRGVSSITREHYAEMHDDECRSNRPRRRAKF